MSREFAYVDVEGIKKHREVFNAWLDGAEVERSIDGKGSWVTLYEPTFYADYHYRVKPVLMERYALVSNDGYISRYFNDREDSLSWNKGQSHPEYRVAHLVEKK